MDLEALSKISLRGKPSESVEIAVLLEIHIQAFVFHLFTLI